MGEQHIALLDERATLLATWPMGFNRRKMKAQRARPPKRKRLHGGPPRLGSSKMPVAWWPHGTSDNCPGHFLWKFVGRVADKPLAPRPSANRNQEAT